MKSKKHNLEILAIYILVAVFFVAANGCHREKIYFKESFEKEENNVLSVFSNKNIWKKSVDILLKKNTKLLWQWKGSPEENYKFWLKLLFANHKTIYYVAQGSRNPDVAGERYRGKDERMRFSPAVVISALPISSEKWINITVNIELDYLKHCGATFRDIKITEIEIYMDTPGELHIDNLIIGHY